MFSVGSYQPTYSGPITATGESYTRPRNEGRALSGLLGDSRQYRPQNRGISAGSKMFRYQAGIQADQAAQQGLEQSRQAMLQQATDRGEAVFQNQANRADELNDLKNLMLERTKTDETDRLAKRGEQFDTDVFHKKQAADRYAAEKQRQAQFWNTILGIL